MNTEDCYFLSSIRRARFRVAAPDKALQSTQKRATELEREHGN